VGAGVNIPRHHGFSPEELARLPASEQEQAKQLLKALDDLRREDPLQFFQPHAKQHELLRVFAAPGVPRRQPLRQDDGRHRGRPDPGHRPRASPSTCASTSAGSHRSTAASSRPDFTATMEGVVYQKLREWAPRAQLVGDSWSKAYDKQNRILRFKNGSWFQFMTYEQDLDKFGGAALHRIHYDEEPPESIRKECLMRLIDYGGEELFTMTPLMGMTWMFDAIWEKWEKGELEEATSSPSTWTTTRTWTRRPRSVSC
jgi:phage terminase large subunit-like protein